MKDWAEKNSSGKIQNNSYPVRKELEGISKEMIQIVFQENERERVRRKRSTSQEARSAEQPQAC